MRQPARRPADRAQAGAVNVIIFIVVLILLAGAVGLWFVANDDVARFQGLLDDERAKNTALDAKYTAVLEDFQGVSNVVGFRDEANISAKSEPAAMQLLIDGAKSQLGTALGSEGVTLEKVITTLQAQVAARDSQITQLSADLDTERQARASADANVASITSDHRGQLDALNQQISDEQARADNQAQTDQTRIDDLLASEQNKDALLRAAQRDLADLEASYKRQLATAEATIRSLNQKKKEVMPEMPDGEVLSVSDSGTLAYIDVGARDGLQAGTRFEVLRMGQGGGSRSMGTLEVQDVDDDMAMAGLVTAADPFDPILPGDVIRNPHFDRSGGQRFYLLGDFPLTMSREFVAQRLVALGGSIDESLSTDTDVLVLGYESPAEGEFAQALSETDEFILADKLGTRVMRLDDLAKFLKY